MKKYRTWYDTRIEEVDVVSETAKFVIIEDRNWSHRSLKHPERNDDTHYHDTWQEAKDFLIDREQDAIVGHRNDIERHQKTLEKIMEMTQ